MGLRSSSTLVSLKSFQELTSPKFLDLSAQVHATLLDRFPELRNPPPYDDPTEKLPMPPVTALDWKADALVDLDDTETETDDPDWNDVALLIGSEIVRDVRAAVRAQLKYTCSAVSTNQKQAGHPVLRLMIRETGCRK